MLQITEIYAILYNSERSRFVGLWDSNIHMKGRVLVKLIEYLKELGKSRQVDTKRLTELKIKYVGAYRARMVELYRLGYIDDPTKLNFKNLYGTFVDLNIKNGVDRSGYINLSSEYLQYVYFKNNSREVKYFVGKLRDCLKYREYCRSIDSLYDYFNFDSKSHVNINYRFRLETSMINSILPFAKGNAINGFDMAKGDERPFNEALVEVFCDKDECIETLDINELVWKEAMMLLEIPTEDWTKDGLFDRDLSHSQEVECCRVLFSGVVELTGKYSERVNKWYDNNVVLDGDASFYKGIFRDKISEMCQLTAEYLNSLEKDGKDIIAVSSNKIYLRKKVSKTVMSVGCFVVMNDGEDHMMYDGVVMEGYTGECYDRTYLDSEEIGYVGCPILLHLEDGSARYFYDLEQCDIKSDTWFKTEDLVLSFYTDRSELPKIKESFRIDSLEKRMMKAYYESLMGNLFYTVNTDELQNFDKAKKSVMKKIV